MNVLVLLPDEITTPSQAVVANERLQWVHESYSLTEGLRIPAVVYGGMTGTATVVHVLPDRVEFEIAMHSPPPKRLPLELVVAVPRPQTVKKVLHAATVFGVQRIHFIRTALVVKSYLDSRALSAECIFTETVAALAQCGDSVAPAVEVHRLFAPFIQDYLPALMQDGESAGGMGIFADTGLAEHRASVDVLKGKRRIVLAVGPEKGWTDHERMQFRELGFIPWSLGERVVRVDTAVVAFLGQMQLV